MPYWNNRTKKTNPNTSMRVIKRKPITVYFDKSYYIFNQNDQRASDYFLRLEYADELDGAVSLGYATKIGEDTLIQGHMSMKRMLVKVDALVNKGKDIDPEISESLRREISGLWTWLRDPRSMMSPPAIPENDK
jgi:hypothetical protein